MKGDVIESNSPSVDLSDKILNTESLERLKKKKKGRKKTGKVTYDFKIWSPCSKVQTK